MTTTNHIATHTSAHLTAHLSWRLATLRFIAEQVSRAVREHAWYIGVKGIHAGRHGMEFVSL
jgi:hypothetical protein